MCRIPAPKSILDCRFIPSGKATEIAVDLEVAARLRAVCVVQTAVGSLVKPDAGEQVEVLIGGNAVLDGDQPFDGDVPDGFFARLKRWDRSAAAAGGAAIAVFDDG